MELINDCEKKGIPILAYVFDSWFLCRAFAEYIKSHRNNWVSRLKS